MEDSFRVRVEKAFGSLAGPTPSSSLSNLWCLSDEEVQRRECNRSDSDDSPSSRDEPPNPTRRLSCLQELDPQVAPDALIRNKASEGWEIRSSIGLDCTLDHEEEEDEFDKVAVGLEGFSDLLYRTDVDDYGIHFGYSQDNMVAYRDPRANHMAAKLRLMEDSEAAADFHSSNLPNVSLQPPSTKPQQVEDGTNLKPILKKRERTVDSRSPKRVRFFDMSPLANDTSSSQGLPQEATLLEEGGEPLEQVLLAETKAAQSSTTTPIGEPRSLQESSLSAESSIQVPDYVRNPSKYTRYTLDSDEGLDEVSNKKAFMDFVQLLRKPRSADFQPDDFDVNFPKSVVFTPKKKMDNTSFMITDTEPKTNKGEVLKDKAFIGIAAAEAHDDRPCAMDEDVLNIDANNNRGSHNKPSRQYRSRGAVVYDD